MLAEHISELILTNLLDSDLFANHMSDKTEKLTKVKEFAEQVRNLVGSGSNYNTLTVATERHDNGVAIQNNPDLHNCVRSRVYLRPNEHHTHLEDEKVRRRRAEQVGSIASGTRATSVTSTRKARETSKKEYYEKYPGPVKVLKIGGTESRGYPIYEVEYTIPVF